MNWNPSWGHLLEYIPNAPRFRRYDLIRDYNGLIGHLSKHPNWIEQYQTIHINVKKHLNG